MANNSYSTEERVGLLVDSEEEGKFDRIYLLPCFIFRRDFFSKYFVYNLK